MFTFRDSFIFRMKMIFQLFLVVNCVNLVFTTRLTPLENNDKLEDIKTRYVAEWQWESWPIKQETIEQDHKVPGPRMNPVLWKSTSGSTWYLFGGYPVGVESKRMNSDVWKYTVVNRVWESLLPSYLFTADEKTDKKDGKDKLEHPNTVVCGTVAKPNATMDEKFKILYQYTRRKKFEDKRKENLKSVAVYTTRGGKSNTVWQIDLKDRLWTTYVCCCDTTKTEKENASSKKAKPNKIFEKIQKETLAYLTQTASYGNESLSIESKADITEENLDSHQQPTKNKKKKINQSKKGNENSNKKTKEVRKRSNQIKEEDDINSINSTNAIEHLPIDGGNVTNVTIKESTGNHSKVNNNKSKKEPIRVNTKDNVKTNKTQPLKSNKTDKTPKPTAESPICPEFEEQDSTIAWCDGKDELIITADVSLSQLALWTFDLKTSHWSRQEVKIPNGTKWLGCSKSNLVRYAGLDDEVYIFCSLAQEENESSTLPPNNLTTPSVKNPSETSSAKHMAYRINYKRLVLEFLGQINFGSNLNSSESQEIWRDDSQSIIKVVRTPEKDVILILAHSDSVDLWILRKDEKGKYYFDLVDKIWRGSALKWFKKYFSALYNLEFAADVGNGETILMPNPRAISKEDYWPRERGRFIIRIYANENYYIYTNDTFENRTKEQNLTYDLLQSDLKMNSLDRHLEASFSAKVVVFVLITALVSTSFTAVIVLKKFLNSPLSMRYINQCKYPVIIRYSIIPDTLLQPVA